MDFAKGSFVRHPKQDWGPGRILDCIDHKVRVLFEAVGEKTIDSRFIQLIPVDPPTSFEPSFQIDIERLRSACDRFYNEMKDNRSTTNDGSLAQNVMRDIETIGELNRETLKQLAKWCTTDGVAYQRGVYLAREISLTIFGRLLTRGETENIR